MADKEILDRLESFLRTEDFGKNWDGVYQDVLPTIQRFFENEGFHTTLVGEDDTEGHILEKVRTELGFKGLVVLSLDLHANFTRRMLEHAGAERGVNLDDLVQVAERVIELVCELEKFGAAHVGLDVARI